MGPTPDQFTGLNSRVKILNAQLAFMEDRLDEQRRTSSDSFKLIVDELQGIKGGLEKLAQEQHNQWKRLQEIQIQQVKQEHIHQKDCIQQGSIARIEGKIQGLYAWKDELSKDLLEYNFVKKYPKLLYLLVFVAVVLALVAIYKLSKV